jgi:hypothetical protein
MKNKIRVYCDFSCLQEIYEQCHKPIADFKQEDKPLVWANLYSLLYEQSELFVNLTDSKFQDLKENPFFNKLFKDNKLYNFAEDFDKIDKKEDEFLLKIPPQTLFFLDKTPEECKNLEEDFGMLFISKTELVQKAAWLFSWAVRSMQKKNAVYTSWEFLKEFRHPCNSLVLADNYVLKDEKLWAENLLLILKYLLPEKLNKQTFQLTILTDIDERDIEKRFTALEKLIKFDYKITCCVIRTPDIHDRNIITNYAWLSSGYGFTLFSAKKVTKSTTLNFLPITYLHTDYPKYHSIKPTTNETFSFVSEVVKGLLEDYKEINDKAQNSEATESTSRVVWFQATNNEKQNRLLNTTF